MQLPVAMRVCVLMAFVRGWSPLVTVLVVTPELTKETTHVALHRFGFPLAILHVQGALGARPAIESCRQYDLGPGGIWIEAGYRYVAIENRVTAGENAMLSVIAAAIGYRFAF